MDLMFFTITITKLEQSNTQFGTLGVLDPNAQLQRGSKSHSSQCMSNHIGEVSLDNLPK